MAAAAATTATAWLEIAPSKGVRALGLARGWIGKCPSAALAVNLRVFKVVCAESSCSIHGFPSHTVPEGTSMGPSLRVHQGCAGEPSNGRGGGHAEKKHICRA